MTCRDPAPWRFCIAPMMQYTDRHFRYFARRLSRHARLYTEMVVASALLRGNAARLLAHHDSEHPVALQLGGCDPRELADAAAVGQAAGYDEINLNLGCPSDRVRSGRFGACLIAEPSRVAACVAAMRRAVTVPVTVKTRLGVDDCDSQAHLEHLVRHLIDAGCDLLIVHARKALLGFSPRANREVPPLEYARVYALKQTFPDLPLIINGGIDSIETCRGHLAHVDGVMLGRTAYAQPALLAQVDTALHGTPGRSLTEAELLRAMLPYVEREMADGTALHHLSRHWMGLCQGTEGARAWRKLLASHAIRRGLAAGAAVEEAVAWFATRARAAA